MTEEQKKEFHKHYCEDFLPREWFDKPGERTMSEQMYFTAQYFCDWGRKKLMEEICDLLSNKLCDYVGLEHDNVDTFMEIEVNRLISDLRKLNDEENDV